MKKPKVKRLPPYALTRSGARYPIEFDEIEGVHWMYSKGDRVQVVGINHAMGQAQRWELAGVRPPNV